MSWTVLVHLGDIEHTVALAVAITAWLVATRAWRMAFWWSLLFTLGIGMVSVNKVAFMAWGMTWHSLDFKAISGHASGVTAVVPTLFYLLLHKRGVRAQAAAVGFGLTLGALMALLLVLENHHSTAEALAGWTTGAVINLGAIRMGGALPTIGAPPYVLGYSLLVFAAAGGVMHALPYVWLMHRTAALLSRI